MITDETMLEEVADNREAVIAAVSEVRHTKGRSEKRQIVISAGSNVVVMAAKIILGFFVAPILVHNLGDARYGAWMFVSQITAYLLLGDFGVENAVTRFVARHDGLNDLEGINRIFNTSLALMSAVGVALLSLALIAGHFWGLPLNVPAGIRTETTSFFVLQAVLVAMLLPICLPNALLAGLGRFPARNAISLVSLLMRQAMLVGVVWYGGGLVEVGAVLILQCAVDFGMSYLGARRYFPALRCSFRYVDRKTLRTLLGYGANVFLGDICALLIGQSAVLIIGATLKSCDAITYFSVGASLRDYAVTFLATIVLVLSPAVSKWQAMGRDASIRSAIAHAVRYILYAALAFELGLLSLGYPFLALWMGEKYAIEGYPTLFILSLSVVFSAINIVSARTLEGLGRVRPLAMITVAEAIAVIGLGVPLVRHFGIEGAAIGLAITLAMATTASFTLVCRYLGIGAFRMLFRACWAPSIAGVFAASIWLLIQHWLPINNWLRFLLVGSAGTLPFAVVAVLVEPDIRRGVRAAMRASAGLLVAVVRVPGSRTGKVPAASAAAVEKGLPEDAPAWQFWKLRNRILLVGYSLDIPGGVTTITQLLRGAIPNLDLHIALRFYKPRWKSVLFSMWSILCFVIRLAIVPPRIVQIIVASHGDALRTLPYLVLAKSRGCQVCLHFHKNRSAIFDGYSPRVRELVLRLWRWAGRYCFLSKRLRDEFSGLLDVKTAWIIHNPISEAWLQSSLNSYEQRTMDLAFFGRWSPEKGTDDLTAAMRGMDGVHCHIYSDRGEGEACDNCIFHDWLTEREVRQVLRHAKVLLLPSRAEAFPTILLEAAACGTPFVATKIVGVEDIVEESRAGLVHETGDVQAMRAAVMRLVTDRDLWLQMSLRGRRWVESLAVSKVVLEWKSRYAELGVHVTIDSSRR